jgi:D-alanyl-D-alanine carboxypeptidase
LIATVVSKRADKMTGIRKLIAIFLLVSLPFCGFAAPYAAIVIDVKSGKVLHSENANTRLHPAGLTKLATLYEVFTAVEKGEIKLDDLVRVSRNAAETSPVNLELREGQRLKVRDLIRATAVMGANDTATVLAEAISGSEAPFARRMNRTAKELGMTRSTFKNPHGLTEKGHLTTARDIATIMQALDTDLADFMHIFTRVNTKLSTTRTIQHSGHRLIKDYKEATAVKTGYTRASGFSGAIIAEKRSDRIIVVVFGGKSTKTRNTQMIKLAELGFRKLQK